MLNKNNPYPSRTMRIILSVPLSAITSLRNFMQKTSTPTKSRGFSPFCQEVIKNSFLFISLIVYRLIRFLVENSEFQIGRHPQLGTFASKCLLIIKAVNIFFYIPGLDVLVASNVYNIEIGRVFIRKQMGRRIPSIAGVVPLSIFLVDSIFF